MCLGWANVSSKQLGRNGDAGIAIYLLAFKRVVVVASPKAVSVINHAEVNAATARGARLDLKAWMTALQFIKKSIDSLSLRAHRGTVKVPRVGNWSVVIPLDVGNVVFAQDCVNLAEHVIVGARVRQIEHMLPTCLNRGAAVSLHDPIRVSAIKFAVWVDHLGFEPKAELHAVSLHHVNQRLQTVWPNIGRNHPVAEASGVVAASTEPSVI